jgi:hypothetical protein
VDVLPLGCLKCESLAHGSRIFGTFVGPKFFDRRPEIVVDSLCIRVSVLDDKSLDSLWMAHGKPITNGSPVVLHVETVFFQSQPSHETVHNVREMIKGILELVC